MIFVYHNSSKVLKVETEAGELLAFETKLTIAEVLSILAHEFKSEKLVWCHSACKDALNLDELNALFHHDRLMLSYTVCDSDYFGDVLGYVDESVFLNVNKKVCYPTWKMSSVGGMIHASVLIHIKNSVPFDKDFDYYLNSLAKTFMLSGLLCYSEPKLFKASGLFEPKSATVVDVFKFVKQHYKTQWVFLLLFNLMVYERRFPVLAMLFSLFCKKRKNLKIDLEKIEVKSSMTVVDKGTIDVIIPTIGRKSYLYDVLKDLAQQTHLPKKVIIVEQNPQKGSESELDYLTTESWPFAIKHIFTHQSGACNARNLALAEISSEWVFLNDDDNRFDENLIENVFKKAIKYGSKALTTVYLKPDEIQHFTKIHQSGIFGSGNSFVKSSVLAQIRFDMALEFGYGEDTDFGCQLRNNGNDILFFPDLKIIHLKAPMGGFRIPIKKQWEDDLIQPKPSPTIMYLKRKHFLSSQIRRYKMIYFIKSVKNKPFVKWYSFYKMFQKKWNCSVEWSNKISFRNVS
ncbi:glycosyltransferase family 2 protein [Flavobacterium ajazii]|uniref:glycosyltransferase family 2 protein n=1 Tax=Flavobacterium ajazii TaxID=2692318 RepID=UPI0013D5DC27|nr:glycosyltransferase family A protein [Flavobacterium ajazii]